jgi:C-terminal processing protease CtpA/Prc
MAMTRLGCLLLVSDGLGPKRWHGRVAIITNEHTVSAGEMVAAFASENGLAKLVGTETAGRLIPGSGFKVGYGYVLVMPKAEYVTWGGQRFEGSGVKPDIEVPGFQSRLLIPTTKPMSQCGYYNRTANEMGLAGEIGH